MNINKVPVVPKLKRIFYLLVRLLMILNVLLNLNDSSVVKSDENRILAKRCKQRKLYDLKEDNNAVLIAIKGNFEELNYGIKGLIMLT